MHMENQHSPSRDSLALARKHVRALTDGGVSREALLRALLEEQQEGTHHHDLPPLPLKSNALSRSQSQSQSQSHSHSHSPTPAPLHSHSQSQSQSHWSVSTAGGQDNEIGHPPTKSAGHQSRFSTSTTNSESKSLGSSLSVQTNATSNSSARSSTITQFPGAELFTNRPAANSTRAYWCTSCDTEFKRKFDWKRHEDEFHERYKKYPCPDCNRVFWGANTFNQHHKTRHNCKTCPHAEKVIKYTRRKRAWACGFCAAFLPSMDRYIDHIGLHFEAGRTKAHWFHSNVIYGLLHQPGINEAWKNVIAVRFGHLPKDQQPHYGWDLKLTGRKQGFLENESAGQLQDLLEFYNPTKDDPMKIVRLALDKTELTMDNLRDMNGGKRGSPEAQPPPVPKRDKAKKRGPSGIQRDLAPPPTWKERPATQWPSSLQEMSDIAEIPDVQLNSNMDVDMSGHTESSGVHHQQQTEYDQAAIPPPLFAQSPPPHPAQFARPQSLNTMSDPPPYTGPPAPFPGMPRDTVIDLLSEYMGSQGGDQQLHDEDTLSPLPPTPLNFSQYHDWSSMCSTMVDDVPSPSGPPLPPAPNERRVTRRSDVWPSNGATDTYYEENPREAYEIPSFPVPSNNLAPPPPIGQQQHQVRRSDVWAATGTTEPYYDDSGMDMDHHNHHHVQSVANGTPNDGAQPQQAMRRSDVWAAMQPTDYDGHDYENEVAPAPAPASSRWL